MYGAVGYSTRGDEETFEVSVPSERSSSDDTLNCFPAAKGKVKGN